MNLFADRPLVQDSILAVAAAGFAVVALFFDVVEPGSARTVAGFVLLSVVFAALLVRRRLPFVVLFVVTGARIAMTWDVGNDAALAPAAMLTLYTVARAGNRRTNLTIAFCGAVVLMVAVAALNREDFVEEFAGEAALLLLPIAVADAARSRADRVRDLIETESAARVQAERLRIARDLHDVVAHGLSTIAVQSGVAAHLLARNPNQAKESLEIINDTGKRSLEELRAMVGVLRSTDEDSPLRPAPADPNDLSDIVVGASNAGLSVSLDLDGQFPPDVSDACVVAVHRIIQEALTNVARHAGPVPVEVTIHHGERCVEIQILNRSCISRGEVPSTGVGIVGMTERAEALGGSLRARPTKDGGFRVDSTIFYHRPATPEENR